MSEPALEVIDAGPACAVQDLGRSGHQAIGVPRSGAMDATALRIINALVGNDEAAAGLEFRVMGPHLRAEGARPLIAVAGASGRMSPPGDANNATINVEPWRGYRLEDGWSLKLQTQAACFGYLSVSGGIEVAPFLGSRATYQRAGFGGYHGRVLAAGDRLPVGDADPQRHLLQLRSPPHLSQGPIRVMRGPQADYFTPEAWQTFLSTPYRVSRDADRMGIRLEGQPLEHDPGLGAEIVSDGLTDGAIQVPGSGLPIVLLADRQTVGGYPKIAVVATVDLPRFAQLGPGDVVHFAEISVEQAQEALVAAEDHLAKLIDGMVEAKPPGGIDTAALWTANIAGDAMRAARYDEED